MKINIDDYDIDAIREYLKDYYGTAFVNISPFAVIDLVDLDTKSDYEILWIGINTGLNLDDYYIGKRYFK